MYRTTFLPLSFFLNPVSGRGRRREEPRRKLELATCYEISWNFEKKSDVNDVAISIELPVGGNHAANWNATSAAAPTQAPANSNKA